MSLLLDALDRADKERGRQLITPSSPVTPPTSPSKEVRIKRWVIEAIIGLLLLGLVLYVLFFRTSIDVSDPVAAANTFGTLATSASDRPGDSPIEDAPKQLTQQTEIPQQEAKQVENAENVIIRKQASTVSKPDSIVSRLYQQQDGRETSVKNDTALSAPTSMPSSAPSTTRENTGNNPVVAESTDTNPKEAFFQHIPLLSDMPTDFKRRVPSLKYSTHVYSKGTQAGFVNINGPFREVGSQVAPGVKLIAILPEGVVLEMDGELFRLRALNDWVAY